MGHSSNRRKILVVNKSVQRRIVLAVVLVPTVGLAFTTLIVAVFCRRLLTESLAIDGELPSLIPLLLSVLGFFVVCSVVMAVQGLRFSHRIAGPAFRLCKSLERIRSGDIGFRVTLRRGDYLTEIAEELNETLDWLNANPPQGVRTGTDVFEVGREPEDDSESVDDVVAMTPSGRAE
ncbi:MAG: hypothetical protein KDB80_03915 [Planctomycetes bacterium]|nr:hypothetical protein [Planctomycetota bacterium]